MHSTQRVIRLVNGRKDFLIPIRNDADMHTRAFYTRPRTRSTLFMLARWLRVVIRGSLLSVLFDVLPLLSSGLEKQMWYPLTQS